MIRALVIVAVAGFLMAIGCISAAVAIGGPQAFARSGWTWTWGDDDHPPRFGWRPTVARGPQTQRDFPWSGDRLEVNAPAEIEYVQAEGPARLTVRGPAAVLDRVRVQGGRISLTPGAPAWSDLHIRLSAPDVTRFQLNGANRLTISGYRQDELVLEASGHAEIDAAGEVKTVRLRLSGDGEADLSELKAAGAEIDISGAGRASVGPSEWARIDISGMGDVDLLTRPKELQTNISGAGRIRTPGDSDVDAEEDGGPKRAT
jgi:hypothetical protein